MFGSNNTVEMERSGMKTELIVWRGRWRSLKIGKYGVFVNVGGMVGMDDEKKGGVWNGEGGRKCLEIKVF